MMVVKDTWRGLKTHPGNWPMLIFTLLGGLAGRPGKELAGMAIMFGMFGPFWLWSAWKAGRDERKRKNEPHIEPNPSHPSRTRPAMQQRPAANLPPAMAPHLQSLVRPAPASPDPVNVRNLQ